MPRYYFRHRWYGYKLKSRHRLKEKVLRLMYIRSLRYKEVSMAKYCYCIDGETFYGNYDSVEKAIEWAKNDLGFEVANRWLKPGDYEIFIGKCVPFVPQITRWDVEDLAEKFSEKAYDYCGAETYMEDISKEQFNDLAEKLNKTFQTWLKENYNTMVWSAEDIEKHVVHIE